MGIGFFTQSTGRFVTHFFTLGSNIQYLEQNDSDQHKQHSDRCAQMLLWLLLVVVRTVEIENSIFLSYLGKCRNIEPSSLQDISLPFDVDVVAVKWACFRYLSSLCCNVKIIVPFVLVLPGKTKTNQCWATARLHNWIMLSNRNRNGTRAPASYPFALPFSTLTCALQADQNEIIVWIAQHLGWEIAQELDWNTFPRLNEHKAEAVGKQRHP